MQYTISSIVVLASLAAAAPAPAPAPADAWEGVIDPWGQYGHKPEYSKRAAIQVLDDGNNTDTPDLVIAGEVFTSGELLKLAKRATIADYVGYIPGCGDDPSNKNTPKPAWSVNQGVKIPKSGDDDQCTTGHGGDHCWTEYYLVEAAVEYFAWQPTGSAINCPSGAKDSCSVAVTSLKQSCSSTSTTTTNGFDWKILDIAGKIDISGVDGGELSAGGSMTWNHAKSTQDITQNCRQDASTATCTWNNDGAGDRDLCHQVWFADRVLHTWGQAQRTCNKCSGDGVQQNTGDGKVCVRGQKEFEFRLPINKLIHCNGKCGSNDPGIEQPPNEPRGAYKAPNNWADVVIGPFTT